jgi:hypothetical protein
LNDGIFGHGASSHPQSHSCAESGVLFGAQAL